MKGIWQLPVIVHRLIDQLVLSVDVTPDSKEMALEVSKDAKKIAHRGNMTMMISEYKRR